MEQARTRARGDESGFVLAILLTALIPIVAMAAAATITLGGRSSRLTGAIKQERALLAAESGIDETIYASRLGILVDGVPIERELGGGMSVRIEPTYFGSDGLDNDGDGFLDDLDPDEDIYQIIATGRYRGAERRIAAYLAQAVNLPPAQSATASQVAPSSIELAGSSEITGLNTNLDGTRGEVSKDKPGLTVAPPHSTEDLENVLTGDEQMRVTGLGGAPSLAVASEAVEMSQIVTSVTEEHDTKLVGSYWGFNLGTGVFYGDGRIDLRTTTRGAGVLCVVGDLYMLDFSRWEGTVIVTGKLTLGDFAKIYGTILVGGTEITMDEQAWVGFSEEAQQVANSVVSVYGTLKGWQEISRK